MKTLQTIVMLLVVFTMSAAAHLVCVDDVNYFVNTDDLTATVSSLADKDKYELTIPESIYVDGRNYPVTAIGQRAFSNCNFSIVHLPETINFIGKEAFYQCKNLAAIKVPDSVSILRNRTFAGCLMLLSIDTGDGVREVERSFYQGSFPGYVRLGKAVEKVHKGALTMFKWLDMDCLQAPELDEDMLDEGRTNVKIFIPKALEDEYALTGWTGAFQDCLTTEECPLPSEVMFSIPDTIYNGSVEEVDCSTDQIGIEFPRALILPPYRILSSNHKRIEPDNFAQKIKVKSKGKCTLRVVGFGGIMSEEQEVEVISSLDILDVNLVEEDANRAPIFYDLSGRVVENPSNGIFIVNGKKVLLLK